VIKIVVIDEFELYQRRIKGWHEFLEATCPGDFTIEEKPVEQVSGPTVIFAHRANWDPSDLDAFLQVNRIVEGWCYSGDERFLSKPLKLARKLKKLPNCQPLFGEPEVSIRRALMGRLRWLRSDPEANIGKPSSFDNLFELLQ
jgi:hypothetical protein